MAYLTIQDAERVSKQAVEQAIKTQFAELASGDRVLRLDSVEFGKDQDPFDYEGQRASKLQGKTWGSSVYGSFTLQDHDGKVLDHGKVKLLTLPQRTGRHTYLYGGQEYQFDTQFRRKPGIFTRISDRGEYVSQISAAGKFFRKTEIYFDPEDKKYWLKIGTSSAPLSVLLDLMDVSKTELEDAVGPEVARANAEKPKSTEYGKVYRSLFGEGPTSQADLPKIAQAFKESELDPDATEYTTGQRLTSVDKTAVLASMKKLLMLVQGKAEEDDPNSLVTKSVLSYDDYLGEWISKQAPEAKRKMTHRLVSAKKVSDVVPSGILGPAVSKLILSPLAQRREQHNLLDIMSGASRTTVRGPGGVSDPHMIRDDMRTIHPSHMAFLDPIKTPEGAAIGTILHVAQTAYKDKNNLKSVFIDLKTGKEAHLTPREVFNAVVAFPDEYEFSQKAAPKPKRTTVNVSYKGDVTEVTPDRVQYVPASPLSLFTATTNLIPFIRSNIGVRAMTAARQVEQAIPLTGREAPLVQVKHGLSGMSSEAVLGRDVGAVVSPVDGTVKSVTKGKIVVEDAKGAPHTVNYYRNFPLNNAKGYIDSELKISVGDTVKKGQIIADTNFTKNGTLALGTNLSVAYTPWRGLTFEDAVAISETAATKLTSDHLHQFEVEINDNSVIGKKKYSSYYPNEINTTQLSKLDDDGVIKVGQEVHKGDFVFAGLAEKDIDPDSEAILKVSKGAVASYSDRAIRWEKSYPGVVTDVEKFGKKFVVHVKTREPAVEGDKIVGRHGNKGIIAKVVPDAEMPRGEDGKAFDILMNPAGVVGRVNLGQVYETLAGKVASKVGKPLVVDNYDDSASAYEHVERLLKAHGVKDSEIVTDPVEGPTDAPVLTGTQYVYKLTHQVDKKLSARGAVSKSTGERLPYTSDQTPGRGGSEGGQTIGILDTYALLAHGATSNLEDMFTYKGDAQNAMYWTRLKSGGVLPAPETPYTAKKFISMLEGMGVHVKKDGNTLQFMPLTDKDVDKMSAGPLKSPGEALDFKNRPVREGIFDPLKTGGIQGKKWTHIELPVPVMNPMTIDGAKRVLAFAHPEVGATIVDKVMGGAIGLNDRGELVNGQVATVVGGAAVYQLLKNVNVEKMLPKVEEELKRAPVSKINVYNKTLKYLRSLKDLGYSPAEAYMLTKVPVLPPEHRPLTIDPTGKKMQNDVNDLYKKLGETVAAVAHEPADLPPEVRAKRFAAVQDMVDAVMVSGYNSPTRPLKSLMQQIVGPSPKYGFYHSKVLKRRQELSARSTIVPNPELDMDTAEIPEKALWELFSPFVTKKLSSSGYSMADALLQVKDRTKVARDVLMEEIKERPVFLKRDPVLHKFGIQAFYAKPSPDDTIRIPPSLTSGFGADFDGDTMAVFVPSTEAAKEEAKHLVASQNIFSPKGGGLMHKPDHEAQLGLYMLTEEGKDTRLSFQDMEQALDAYKQRRLKLTDMFTYQGRKTSLGRLLLANVVPAGRLQEKWYNEIAYNKQFRMDKSRVTALLTEIGKIQPKDFPQLIAQMRQLGDQASFKIGGSFTMKDFKPLKEANKALPRDASTPKRLQDYLKAREQIEKEAKDHMRGTKNNLMRMVDSGARGNWDQLKQINLSPGLMTNAKGEVITRPVNKSYSEGLNLADYWTTLHGARRGMVSKVRGTALPGYLSRQMISSVADVRIVSEDCQTNQGVFESVSDKDINGRYLAKDQKIGEHSYRTGTLVDTTVVASAKAAGVQKLYVRTPMKCEAHDGVCAKCFGLWHDGNSPALGTNIGVISAQSLSEPTTQMSMKLFHEGGLYTPASKTVDSFKKAKELLEVPLKLKDEAVLSKAAGTVTSIRQGATGWDVTVGTTAHFVPKIRNLKVHQGEVIRKGQPLSDGSVNAHALSELAGVGAAQEHLVSELHGLFAPLGVDKRHTETIVRYMTSMGVVSEAPAGSGFSRGDIVAMPQVDAYNKKYMPVDWAVGKKTGEKYLNYGAGTIVTDEIADELRKHGILRIKVDETGYVKASPVIKGVNTLPLIRTDDPLAKMSFERLKETLEEGSLTGSRSDLSGAQPLPAIGFGKIKPAKL